ncbi:MAG: polymerase subunit chi [Gammaproteobacteria bacterium]|jgi:DNA polymerase-3 subunit chi|nr:polymerase subunit chi [Gammaproteobacteria bacterium]
MQDSAGTSDSAASSGGSSSLPGSSGDSSSGGGPDALRVDFYVLEESSAAGRLKLACRLAEKAYLAEQVALVWHTDAQELKAFDDLLWTFMEGSFVPHEMLSPGASVAESPVILSAGTAPPVTVDIIINLAPEVPACLSQTRRVAEIIDGDDARRRAGRARFKAYRDLGIQPASHNIRSDG